MRKAILLGLVLLLVGLTVSQVVVASSGFPIHVKSILMPRRCYRNYEYGAIRVHNPYSWNVPVLVVWPTNGWESGQEEATLAPGEYRNFAYQVPRRGWELYSAEVYVWFDHDTGIEVNRLNNYCKAY